MSNLGSRISGFFGSTGGGGGGGLTSVAVDGITIIGNGTVGNPLIATGSTSLETNIDLGTGNYTPINYGTYIVTDGFDTYSFLLPTVWGNLISVQDGQRLTIINSTNSTTGNIPISGSGGASVYYQGTYQAVTSIPSGMVYEFVYAQATSEWFCYYPTPQITPAKVDLNALGSTYNIPTIGNYSFYNNSSGYGINLPSPANFNGLQIVIMNLDTVNSIPYVNPNKPKGMDGIVKNSIPPKTCDILICANITWNLASRY